MVGSNETAPFQFSTSLNKTVAHMVSQESSPANQGRTQWVERKPQLNTMIFTARTCKTKHTIPTTYRKGTGSSEPIQPPRHCLDKMSVCRKVKPHHRRIYLHYIKSNVMSDATYSFPNLGNAGPSVLCDHKMNKNRGANTTGKKPINPLAQLCRIKMKMYIKIALR